MKSKLLSSNAYSLITIGSTMILEGSNFKLGSSYVILGLILLIVENHFSKEEPPSNP